MLNVITGIEIKIPKQMDILQYVKNASVNSVYINLPLKLLAIRGKTRKLYNLSFTKYPRSEENKMNNKQNITLFFSSIK